MSEFAIQEPTRVCAATGRPLAAGEKFHGLLREVGGKFVRTDYAADAWPGPPPDAVAHWTGRVPAADKPRRPVVNDALLLDCFDQLAAATEPHRLHFRYVLALLLMRRKKLKFEDARKGPDGADVLVLRDTRGGGRTEVADPRMTEDEIAAVQEQVFQTLGWE